jgi:hypothetical protein
MGAYLSSLGSMHREHESLGRCLCSTLGILSLLLRPVWHPLYSLEKVFEAHGQWESQMD